jgi:DNA-binding XRE family transcriptional regulator
MMAMSVQPMMSPSGMRVIGVYISKLKVYLTSRQWQYTRGLQMVAQMQHSAMITTGQIRAARALIGWTQVDLAKASGVSEISIKNIERGATDPRASTLEAFQRAFEKAGVVFLEPGDIRDGGEGVRLKKPERRR